jgi:uroporphyrinogen III methyltransferase/synthase
MSLSPAVIVIGEVVKLRKMVAQSSLPLEKTRILVTRPARQSSEFKELLEQQGATVVEMPALEIRPPSSWQWLDSALADIKKFDWLILTSANGVEYFFARLREIGKDSRALAGVKIAVVGQKTASSLTKQGLRADFIPADFVADAMVAHFPEDLKGKKILFPRVETGGRDLLVKELGFSGALVEEVPAYESGCPEKIDSAAWEALAQGKIDLVTFASSKTVRNFYDLVEQQLKEKPGLDIQSLLSKVLIASIGPQTSKTCHELLGRVDIEAKEYTLEGLRDELISYFHGGCPLP